MNPELLQIHEVSIPKELYYFRTDNLACTVIKQTVGHLKQSGHLLLTNHFVPWRFDCKKN